VTVGKPGDDKKDIDDQIADTQILKNLWKYLMLNDSPDFRFRLVMSLGLLVGAKVNATRENYNLYIEVQFELRKIMQPTFVGRSFCLLMYPSMSSNLQYVCIPMRKLFH
jgi:hypothetical protein